MKKFTDKKVKLGQSDLMVSPICLGTMVFGDQVDESTAYKIMDRALERGVDFMDTAEAYAVPLIEKNYTKTETIIGNYFAKNAGKRKQWVVATKVVGMTTAPWVRGGKNNTTADDIATACDASLKRLQTDVIDLYQIHWPNRMVPVFGTMYYDPTKEPKGNATIHEQLVALDKLVKAGKVRAIGLSNETPYGVHEFVRLAEQHGLARVATVQNPYSLTSRALENGLDETMHRLGVSLIPYSPLAFGVLSGKYDEVGIEPVAGKNDNLGRMSMYQQFRAMRYARPEALAIAKLYNQLARDNGLTPTQLALSFIYHKWQVASTIIGVSSVAQLDECIDAYDVKLSDKILAEIDAIRLKHRDPAS
ncbi:MAG: aldo/keto reductase [Hydrotalea sp.]|nr:aldo/keto reductase [Hydrotalea sp.]